MYSCSYLSFESKLSFIVVACCCFLFREKAAPKAKLRRRKCSWNSPKISKFPALQFLSFEKRLWKELFVRASAARQGVPSSGKFMWDLQTYSAKKKSREKFSSRGERITSSARIEYNSWNIFSTFIHAWRLPLKVSWMFNIPRLSTPLASGANEGKLSQHKSR